MMRIKEDFGAAMRAEREKKNVSLAELAEAAGVSEKTAERAESGSVPPYAELKKMLEALGLRFEDISEARQEENPFQKLLDAAQNEEERAGFERMVSMMLCIRKHKNLRAAYEGERA